MRIRNRSGCLGVAMTLTCLVCAPAVGAQDLIDRFFRAGSGAQGYRFPGVIPALRGFDIGYTRDDHHVRRLILGPLTTTAPAAAGDYLLLLRDASGFDEISGSVKLADVRRLGRLLRVAREDCRGECRLRIPPLIGSEAFLLAGFTFEYTPGTDRHVLQVKIRQAAHNGYIIAKFVDNSGTDTYVARVTYAVIPRSAFGPYLVQARSAAPARGESIVPRPPGVALLQSFDLRFLNGDHHLQRISVDLTGDRILARLRDRSGDDPFEWHVEYSILR